MSSTGNNIPPTLWGWEQGPNGLWAKLTTQEAAPPELLKLISCRCEKGCGRQCGCRKGGLKCSEICFFCHGQSCTNAREFEVEELDEYDDEDRPQMISSVQRVTYS